MNENNSDQIICSDSQQTLMKRFSFVQGNKVVDYSFQKYQENIVIVLVNKVIPVQHGQKLEFEYYVSDLNDQTLKLQYIQKDEGFNQYFVDFSISSLGHVVIDSQKIELREIGNNVLLTSLRKNDGIESCLLILSFHQKLNNLSKDTLDALISANQITNEGFIISEGLQTTLNTLSITESEKQKIRNSIIRVHYPIQLKESLIFDELNLLQFTTPSSNVKISLSFKNQSYEFVLKSVFLSEITESVDWYISSDKQSMIISGSPDKVKKFILYFMMRKVKESDEQIVVGFSDFLNSERSITLSLDKFKQNNKNLLKEIKGLIVKNKLQDLFNDIYDSTSLSVEQFQFQIPQNTYVDSDLITLQDVFQGSLSFYEEKNNMNIYYQFFYTQTSQMLDYSEIFVDKQGLKLLSEQTGVVLSKDTIYISINNLREYSLLKKSAEYHRIIICAVNEINRVCDEFSFTLSYSNTLNMLILVLVPIAGILIIYYIYNRMYVIKFFWNMYKVTYSDEKIYTNNSYHKQIPIIFDQFEIAKEIWNYYYAIRILKIEQREAEQKLLYDDEIGQGKYDDQLDGKGSSENAVTAATATLALNGSGRNQNYYPLQVKKSSELQFSQNEVSNTKRQFFNNKQQSSFSSQDFIQNISNIAGLTSGRDASSNNLKGNLGDDLEVQFPSKNITPENSMLKLPLSNIEMKDCSFSHTTPINNVQQGEQNQNQLFTEFSAIQQPYQFQAQFQPQQNNQDQPDQSFNQQNDQSFNQQKDQTFNQQQDQPPIQQQQNQLLSPQQQQLYSVQNEQTLITEQNSPIDTKRQKLTTNNKQDNENSHNMSFYMSQFDNTENTFQNSYQSYQEFIYQNRKIQILGNNYQNSATLKSPLKNDVFGDSSEPFLQFTKFQGPPLSNYQVNSLQKIIEQQKLEDDKYQQIFQKCFQQNKIQYDKTNSYIVRDLINNSKVFNNKVFKLLKNSEKSSTPTTILNEQSENQNEDVGSPRSNKQSYKKQNPYVNNAFFKKIAVNNLRKKITYHTKNISKQVEEMKVNFSKLVRDQLGLKNQDNKRLNNLKEEGLIDEYGCINEEYLIDDIKKTLEPFFEQKISKKQNVTKLSFLLDQVKKLNSQQQYEQCPISRYFFVEFSRHILTIDYISQYMYQYLKSLALLYNNSNDWYKSYLYIIGHDQDNQIYPFPSVISRDDMIQQAIYDLNVKNSGKDFFNLKEKTKIVGQALAADSLDLNKYQNGCGETLQLDPSDEIQTIKAINIQDKHITGKMRQFGNFLSWMFGSFEKQQLLNSQLVPEWLVCGITYNTIHIKGNPNNSQIGRYLILVSGKKKNILRSFILSVVKYQDSHSKASRRQQQFDQASNLYDSRVNINMADFTYDNMYQSQAGFKKEDMKNQHEYSKSRTLRKQFSKESIQKPDTQNNSNNKFIPKNKSLFQKINAPLKSNSIYLNSPKGSSQNIQPHSFKQPDKSDLLRQRVYSEYIDSFKSPPQVNSKPNELNDIDEQSLNEQLTSIKSNPKLKNFSDEDNINDNDSEMRCSFSSENRNNNEHFPQLEGIQGTKFFPNQKSISDNV